MDREELLQQAVEAHMVYLEGVEALKLRRQQAFKRALAGKVSAREIAEQINLSGSRVTRISKGQM